MLFSVDNKDNYKDTTGMYAYHSTGVVSDKAVEVERM